MSIRKTFVISILFSLLMGCASQLPTGPQYIEARVAKKYSCDTRLEKDRQNKCLKWVSQSVDDEQTAEELTDLLVALSNTGRLKTVYQGTRPYDVDQARSVFREKIVNIRGWDTRLDSLLCDINTDACERDNAKQKYKVDDKSLRDITSHYAGYPFATETEINWKKRRGSSAWRVRTIYLLDVEIIRYPNWVNVRNTERLSLAKFLEKNPSYCDGHILTVEIALSDKTPPPNYTADQCYDRYLNDNHLTNGMFDPSDWSEAVLIYPKLGLIFQDKYFDEVIDDTHSRKARRFARSEFPGFEDILKAIIAGESELDTSNLGELLSRLSIYSRSAKFEANSGIESGFFGKTTRHDLPTSKLHSIKRQSARCYDILSTPNLLSKEIYFEHLQKPLFWAINHPSTSQNESAKEWIFGNLKQLHAQGTETLGIMDTDPSAIPHCKNPLHNSSLDTCEELTNKIKNKRRHGLEVASVASAPLHQVQPRQEYGMIGINPCTDLRIRDFDWSGPGQTEALPHLGDQITFDKAKVWNISGSVSGSNGTGKIDPTFVAILRDRIAAWEGSKLFVVSAGSSNSISIQKAPEKCEVYPACLSNNDDGTESRNVLTVVGAELENGVVKLWSNKVPTKLKTSNKHEFFDVAAVAGGQVGSLEEHGLLGATVDSKGKSYTAYLDGVSYAAPQVSAIAAMMYDSFKAIDAYQVKERLIICSQLYSNILDAAIGGLLDAECALDIPYDRLTYASDSTLPGRGETLRGYALAILEKGADGTYKELDTATLHNVSSGQSRQLLSLHNIIDDLEDGPLMLFNRVNTLDHEGSVRRTQYNGDKKDLVVVFKSESEALNTRCVPISKIRSLVYASDKKFVPNSAGLEGGNRDSTINSIRSSFVGNLSLFCENF